MNRRMFLAGSAAATLSPALAWSAPAARSSARFVLVSLRGGLDGLAAAPPVGDPHFGRDPIDGLLPIDDLFALHPGLAAIHPLYGAGDMALIHAVAPPYHERSHFDAQDVMENGTDRPFGASSGWLNRAAAALGSPMSVALGDSLPLLLRGPAPSSNIDPERVKRLDPRVVAGLQALYLDDPLLRSALERGDAMATAFADAGDGPGPERLGRVMAGEGGPRLATFEIGSFDTHTRQDKTLEARLPELAAALSALRLGLGPAWSSTVVAVVSEFGRTVRPNGTGGTDHGVGGVMWLLGGAVAGGVKGQWPGLGERELLEGRDVRPTTDVRQVFKGLLAEHLELSASVVDRDVFPGSAAAPAMRGLVRA
jgi:uncharacterized protein (DUF1501 family)